MKRAFDIIASACGLIVLSPVMLVCACLVKLTSTGPVLFKQKRMGRNFRLFEILKFRSMTVGAEQMGDRVTAGGDNRITGIGRILRKTKLDELPQLLNVLKGDMSLVGPRPEVPEFVEIYREDYQELLSVRPGITDIGSIEFRDEEEILARSDDPRQTYIDDILPQKIELGKSYIKRSSVVFDIKLILLTLLRVVRKENTGHSD